MGKGGKEGREGSGFRSIAIAIGIAIEVEVESTAV
jgi:hypothetical protein